MTIFSLLLALLLGVGMRLWGIGRGDTCAQYLAGDAKAPPTEVVATGTRTIVVPCEEWLPRQPVTVQVLCLVDLILAAVFVVRGLGDARGGFQAWRRRRAGS